MSLKDRVKKIEKERGLVDLDLPPPEIWIRFDVPLRDSEGNFVREEAKSATVTVDGCQTHYERAPGETSDEFEERLADIPMGKKGWGKTIMVNPARKPDAAKIDP